MKIKRVFISLILIITGVLLANISAYAVSYDLQVKSDGKTISMESENPDMSWTIDNLLPGVTDISSVTIKNGGEKEATVETSVSIEEDTGLLGMIDIEISNNAGEVVYEGNYAEFKGVAKQLGVNQSETYTVKTSLNVNAGNEYQNKQYKVKFKFKAMAESVKEPNGTISTDIVNAPKTGDSSNIQIINMVVLLVILFIIVLVCKKIYNKKVNRE